MKIECKLNLVLVTGSRDWTDVAAIYNRLMEEPIGTIVIQGGAPGADTIAKAAAERIGFHACTMHAQWRQLGKKAGPIRNFAMLRMCPSKVLAFRLNMSTGTTDCIKAAKACGIPVEIFERN